MIASLLLSLAIAAPANDLDRAMSDLRFLTTAVEAYSTDNDGLYAAKPDAPREGNVADLEAELAPIYRGTYPKMDPPPRVDPWGHPYRFVISDSRRTYAIYSLGASGKLQPDVDAFLKRLRNDKVAEAELTAERTSPNIVFAGGMLVFTPRRSARDDAPPTIVNRERDTPQHISDSDVELLALAIESYLGAHDALPANVRGTVVHADALLTILTSPVASVPLASIDPWKRPYEIAVSPSGLRAAVYTRGDTNAISDDAAPLIRQTLRGDLTSPATTFAVNAIVTGLVRRQPK